jgi:hypothetical protein
MPYSLILSYGRILIPISISLFAVFSWAKCPNLRDPNVTPNGLVILDEAHKLSADRGNDMRVRSTDRYRLAEALAGMPGLDHG